MVLKKFDNHRGNVKKIANLQYFCSGIWIYFPSLFIFYYFTPAIQLR